MKRLENMMAAGLLSVCLGAGLLTGCGSRRIDGQAAAITVNDETMSVGVANFLLRFQQAETYSMMQSYGMAGGGLWSNETEATSGGEASTYGENYKDSTEDENVKLLLLRAHAADYGVIISEDQQKKIDETAAAAYEANQDAMAGMGVTEADIAEALQLQTYQILMRDPVTADMNREVSDEEAAQTTISYARLSLQKTENGTTEDLSDEEKAAYKKQLSDLLAKIQDSADVSKADIPSLAKTINEEIGAYSYSYGSDDTVMPDEVKVAAAGLEDGQVFDQVIETSNHYYYIVRLDAAFDREATDRKKETILSQRKSETFEAKVADWKKDAKITLSDGWTRLEVTDADAYVLKTPAAGGSGEAARESTTTVQTGSEG